MKFIGFYSKWSVDKYINIFKKKLDKVEYIRNDIIPPDSPVTIVYKVGRAIVNQLTGKLFVFPTTV